MSGFRQPTFVVEFTAKSVTAVLSAAALNGEIVKVDVHNRLDVNKKYEADGQRVGAHLQDFRITVNADGAEDVYEWNYNILRESADRANKVKSHRRPH